LKNDFDFLLICPPGPLAVWAKEQGVEVIRAPFSSKYDIKTVKIILEKLHDASLLHLHGTRAGFLGYLAAKISSSPYIYTEHHWTADFRLGRLKDFIQKIALKRIVNNSACTIAVSLAVKDFLGGFCNRDKIKVVYNGIERNYAQNFQQLKKEELGVLPGLKLILVVSAKDRIKGKEILKKLGRIEKSVILEVGGHSKLGFVSDLRPILAVTDILLVPSLSESFGQIVLEAAAFAVPAVAFAVGGLPEIIEDGKTGILIQPYDVNQMKRAVLELVNNEEKRIRLGRMAQKSLRNFSSEAMAKKTKEIYLECLRIIA